MYWNYLVYACTILLWFLPYMSLKSGRVNHDFYFVLSLDNVILINFKKKSFKEVSELEKKGAKTVRTLLKKDGPKTFLSRSCASLLEDLLAFFYQVLH